MLFLIAVVPLGATGPEGFAAYVLSERGSGRATAYAPTNKIVTVGSRTHVTWLDSEAGSFWNRIRTLDRESGRWSPVWTLGPAQDNHGGAALTVDAQGFLHAAYGPHHGPMRYRRSLRPNDAAEWTEEERFGQDLTYPVLLAAADGTLLFTARRSHDAPAAFAPPAGSRPWETELWRRRPGARWERVGPLLRARFPGYAQFAEAFWWGDDHRTLHLSCRIHETDTQGGGLFTTIGYLVSPDGGSTWQRTDGTRIDLPATSATVDVVARGDAANQRVLTTGGLVADAAGRPQVLYSMIGETHARTFLASPGADGTWAARDLSPLLPPDDGWDVIVPGAITRTARGRIVIAATWQQVPAGESWWAHPSNEVGQLWSDDGGTHFQFERFGPPNPERPRWLPNIERATGLHDVPERPGIIFTDGHAGTGNDDILANRVLWRAGGAP